MRRRERYTFAAIYLAEVDKRLAQSSYLWLLLLQRRRSLLLLLLLLEASLVHVHAHGVHPHRLSLESHRRSATYSKPVDQQR